MTTLALLATVAAGAAIVYAIYQRRRADTYLSALADAMNEANEDRAHHATQLNRAADNIDALAAIIQNQPDERAALAGLTAENQQLRQRATEAMLDAMSANLARYAVRYPAMLRGQKPTRN